MLLMHGAMCSQQLGWQQLGCGRKRACTLDAFQPLRNHQHKTGHIGEVVARLHPITGGEGGIAHILFCTSSASCACKLY